MGFSNVVENATLVNKLIRTFKETFPLQCQQHRVISTRRPGVRDGSRWVTTGMRWTGTGHEPATHRKCWEHQAETVPDLGQVCVTLDFKHKYWCRGRNFSVSLCFLSVRYTVSCLSDMRAFLPGGYLWASSERQQPGSRAMLRSPLLRNDREYCLSFCYQAVPGHGFLNAKANMSGTYQLLWTGGHGVFNGGKSFVHRIEVHAH